MRRGVAALALGVAGVLVAAITVPVSAASWLDQEWVTAPLGAIDCDEPDVVDSTAWGRILSGTLSGQSLEAVPSIDGITVSNVAPATTSSAVSASPVTDLGSDAWTTTLPLADLSGLAVGAGVTLPLGPNNGTYSQYGRATSGGLSVGASGAVSSAGNGVVGLETPTAATPRLASLQLSTLLDSALPGLGLTTAQLADVGMRIGTVGAIASFDSCDPLWDATATGSDVAREYLVDDLGLDFTSSRVTDVATSIKNTIGTLETTIDTLDYVTTTIPSALQTALNSALDLPLASLGSVDSLAVGIDVDLNPVKALVTGPLSDDAVSVNLGTGAVSIDLEAMFGTAYSSSTGLNGQAPNTSVLTPAMLSAVSARVGTLLTTFVTTTIANAITSAINSATVTVAIGAHLDVVVTGLFGSQTPVLDALLLSTTLSGTVGGFTGVAGYAAPVASTTVVVAPGLGLVTSLVNALLGSTLSSIVNAVATNARAIGTTVVTPLKATATAAAGTAMTTITGTTIPAFLTLFGGVLSALDTLVDVVVNAQPDAAGSVGAPAATATGRYFETALHVGVATGGSTATSLFFASASVGPNALR